MVFPFTFTFAIPGLRNPFAATPPPVPQLLPKITNSQARNTVIGNDRPISRSRAGLQKIDRPRPPTSPSPPPTSRKRGWEPSFIESSASSATVTPSSGYPATPAKYRDLARSIVDDYQDIGMHEHQNEEEMPPLKRRRGFAGSIISTAVSAALIGSAVGLTVYRLWRDRGRITDEPHSPRIEDTPPPPPYHQGDWQAVEQPTAIKVAPSTPRSVRKTRHQTGAGGRKSIAFRRPQRPKHNPQMIQDTELSFPEPQPWVSVPEPEAEPDVVDPVEEQMDWIGDKLAMLIEQGKRALNAEVVVMSEAKEDEVDDGFGAWEEEDVEIETRSLAPASSVMRASSLRRPKRPRNIVPIPHGSTHGSPIPSSSSYSGFMPGSAPPSVMVTPGRKSGHARHMSHESSLPTFSREDESSWESPEVRASMERARARLLASRGG